ncbi:MAG: class I SAM-dependent methyltransferase [Verrucomicrobia bacterium]|nr:class I SAM-dependent methyltransferase [Verrucomicrobiota bacterium]
MTSEERAILAEGAAFARQLGSDSEYYWARHVPRFSYFLRLLRELQPHENLRRVLDVGMGFQTLLLERALPGAQIDCLGVDVDRRFPLRPGSVFHPVNLNELEPADRAPEGAAGTYDLVVFMEVVEHLLLPPEITVRYLASYLRPGGLLLLTTPNAAWVRNRLALLFGRNPFERLGPQRQEMGHIREYTRAEIEGAFASIPMEPVRVERTGLYRFRHAKDNLLSACADRLAPSLSRTIVALYRRPL